MKDKLIIAVDFDGTCVKHDFPNIGADIPHCEDVLNLLVKAGHKLILFTMRSQVKFTVSNEVESDIISTYGDTLVDAVKWFEEKNIPLWGINENPSQKKTGWSHSPKPYANIYIDDTALGCPLIYKGAERPYVNWQEVHLWLKTHGILK